MLKYNDFKSLILLMHGPQRGGAKTFVFEQLRRSL